MRGLSALLCLCAFPLLAALGAFGAGAVLFGAMGACLFFCLSAACVGEGAGQHQGRYGQ